MTEHAQAPGTPEQELKMGEGEGISSVDPLGDEGRDQALHIAREILAGRCPMFWCDQKSFHCSSCDVDENTLASSPLR